MGWKYKTNAAQQHKKSKDSGNQFKPVVCKKRMYGKPCDYCNQVAKLAQSEDEDDKTIAGKCRAKSTYYMNVVDMIGKKTNQILASGIQNWRDLIANLPDEDGDGVDFTDPDKAFPIILTRKGKGRNTKYTLKISTKPIKTPAKYLNGMHPLHKVVELLDNEDILFTPAEGKNKFLVLPPWGKEADGDFFSEVFFHWSVDLLGATEDGGDDGFGDDAEEGFGDDDTGDETFSDDFGDDEKDAPKETNGDDDFGDDADDFESSDSGEEETVPDLDSMTKPELIKWCALKKIVLSDKAKAASLEKLLPYVKKKAGDVPW